MILLKRTCNGCKALQTGQGRQVSKCLLGYGIHEVPIDIQNTPSGLTVSGGTIKPAELCPKPSTISSYIYLKGMCT